MCLANVILEILSQNQIGNENPGNLREGNQRITDILISGLRKKLLL